MAQHDQVIDNAPGLAVRTDMNAEIAAIFSSSSGPVEPVVKVPGQLWFDTSTPAVMRLALRDQTNATWLNLAHDSGAGSFNSMAAGDSIEASGPNAFVAVSGGAMHRIGVTDGSNAIAGQVGEVISSLVTTGVPLTSAATATITSIVIPPGDWDVSGESWIAVGTGGATVALSALNTTAANVGTIGLNVSKAQVSAALSASNPVSLALGCMRLNLTVATTYYLIAFVLFPSGTCTATGKIVARRRR
jgi:hypothetical protein